MSSSPREVEGTPVGFSRSSRRARALGCSRVVLDTAAPLREGAAIYLREGYVEIARYNDNPVAARWFEKRLTSPRPDDSGD